jgi:hypothetical protein
MRTEKIVFIQERRSRTIVDVLEEFLVLAKRGEMTGLAFAIKLDEMHSSVGTCGDYTRNSIEALGATQRLINFVGRDDMCHNCEHKQ